MKSARQHTQYSYCKDDRDASRRYHEELDLTPDHADEQIQNHQGRWFGHKESCPSASETDSDEFLYENPIQDSSDEESSYEGGAENLEAVSSDEDTI